MDFCSSKLDFYQSKGFVHFDSGVSKQLLLKLRNLAKQLEESAKKDYFAGQVSNQYTLCTRASEPRLFRYNNLFFEAPELIIQLLASPMILTIFKDLCGNDCVPMQLDLVFKYAHPHPDIAWHQDAIVSRKHPFLAVGIYLDDAHMDDGCLSFVPGTQSRTQDVFKLSSQYGWDIPNVTQQPVKAGDILVHDVMILHGSKPKRTVGSRRTLYLELSSIKGIQESGNHSHEWIELRKQWMAHVVKAADPESIPKHWHDFYGEPKYDLDSLVELIKEKWEPPIPAVWSHKNVEHPDYPTPSELR